MEPLTLEQFTEILKSIADIEGCYIEELFDGRKFSDNFEFIADGNAGDEHECWIVYRYIPTGQHIGLSGFYSSWYEPDFERGIHFMKPVSVTHWYKDNENKGL